MAAKIILENMRIDLPTILRPVEKEIAQLNVYFTQKLHHDNLLINKALAYISLHRGKQLRPAMVFLSAATHGEINPQTHTAALVLELLHTSSLIHDDIVDNGQKRHNKPTLNALWNNKIAVLLGDYLLAECMILIAQSFNQRLLHTVTQTAQEMIGGELLQLTHLQGNSLSKEQYIRLVEQKTASLIAACFEMGTASAGADEKTVQQWKSFGKEVGVIFQIKDDLFDYQKDASFEKDCYKDIYEHKISLPFILALEQKPSSEQEKWVQLYKNHSGTANEIQEIIAMVNENKGIKLAELFLEEKTQQALQFLDKQTDSPHKQSLIALIHYIKDRGC
ncbi:MAG: polyprenyl synthetase family protein [Lentimicrobiaceae bacterium]|nr:polyprenyl synthetase family protein [Lentimicrobiaceae bacterium]